MAIGGLMQCLPALAHIASLAVPDLDNLNARYWDEPCGSNLARRIGLKDHSKEELERFDQAYWDQYPYLKRYIDREDLEDRDVLEVGLGFGSLGQYIIEGGAHYTGIDIAKGPVDLMAERLQAFDLSGHVAVASVLDLPFDKETFDCVVSIGCLHHTGSITRSLSEIRRVLRPRGRAIVMVYNADSLRVRLFGEDFSLYDSKPSGELAPHVELVRPSEISSIFWQFHVERADFRNVDFGYLVSRGTRFEREELLEAIGESRLGLDIYVVAQKR